MYYEKLQKLRAEAKGSLMHTTSRIDTLIRKQHIDAEMASSLVNDNDNVNSMIDKLIKVAELLYGKRDSILEADQDTRK